MELRVEWLLSKAHQDYIILYYIILYYIILYYIILYYIILYYIILYYIILYYIILYIYIYIYYSIKCGIIYIAKLFVLIIVIYNLWRI